MYSEKTLNCKECGCEFPFTASEQEFYAEKGFVNDPARCPDCRSARKAQIRNSSGARGYGQSERQMFTTTCAGCGREATVPFNPSGDRPVYCRDCYRPQPRSNSW